MKRIILIAYDMNPNLGSESGRAYIWKRILSKKYPMDIYVDAFHASALTAHSDSSYDVRYHFIDGIKPWRMLRRLTGLWNIPTTIFSLKVKRALRNMPLTDYSLIHCLTPAGIYSYNDLYKLGLPVIIGPLGGALPTPRGFPSVFGYKFILREWFYMMLLKIPAWNAYIRGAKCIIIGNPEMKKRLPSESHNRCITIFDAVVDVDKYHPLDLKQANSKVVVLFAGRLAPSKGITLLVKAAVKLLNEKKVKNFVIQVAGTGPLQKEIESIIKMQDLSDNISLLGHIPKADLIYRYQNADIFCLPTLREPGGNAILEAMACGLPIISTNYGGPSVSVTDQCGIKVDVNTEKQYVDDLAEALCYLIANEDVRIKMGLNARTRAINEFSINALEKKISSLYDDVIS